MEDASQVRLKANAGERPQLDTPYPCCFPEDIHDKIIQDGAQSIAIESFRLCVCEEVNRDAFRSTKECLESNGGQKKYKQHCNLEQNELDLCSTSLADRLIDIQNLRDNRKRPKGKIAFGRTDPSCGLSMRTINSVSGRGKDRQHHIDWWIYRDATPEAFFELCEE